MLVMHANLLFAFCTISFIHNPERQGGA